MNSIKKQKLFDEGLTRRSSFVQMSGRNDWLKGHVEHFLFSISLCEQRNTRLLAWASKKGKKLDIAVDGKRWGD